MASLPARHMKTALAHRATLLSRRIYTSLPLGYRFAQFLVRLALDTRKTFGKVALGTMLSAGVEGLPDINGKPAGEFREKVRSRGVDSLPRGYGRAFGESIWSLAKKKLFHDEVVEEVFGSVLMKLVEGKIHFREGASFSEAKSYLIQTVLNAGKDLQKHIKRNPLMNVEDIDLGSPEDFSQLDKILSTMDLRRLMTKLRSVHERAPEWFASVIEGMSSRDLAQQWGLSEASVSKWLSQYLPRIRRVVYDTLSEAV